MNIELVEAYDASNENYLHHMCPIYYRNSIGCMCVFDVTNQTSFINLKHWIAEYKNSFVKVSHLKL